MHIAGQCAFLSCRRHFSPLRSQVAIIVVTTNNCDGAPQAVDLLRTIGSAWRPSKSKVDGLDLSLCYRWHMDAPTAGIESSRVIAVGIIPISGFPTPRLRAFNQKHSLLLPSAAPILEFQALDPMLTKSI